MSAIFGGSKQKSQSTSQSTSQSSNQAYPALSQAYMPAVNQGNTALSSLSALLGLGGDKAGANAAYDNYLGSTDYQRTTADGNRAITSNSAVRGLLGSGSTLKRLTEFGQGNQQKYFGDYLAKLLGISQSGMQAGGLISGAGGISNSSSTGQSTGQSSSTGGLAALIGAAASGAAKG